MHLIKTINNIVFRLNLVYVPITLTCFMLGCSKSSNQNNEVVVDEGTMTAPLPLEFRTLTPSQELEVQVEVGGDTVDCDNLVVVKEEDRFSCNIALPSGNHSLSLIYWMTDTELEFPAVRVATSSTVEVQVIPGQSSTADFAMATYDYDHHSDEDGINNFMEISEGSNPRVNSYYVGGSVIGLDEVNELVLTLNNSIDLTITSNEIFKFIPALDDNSSYSVAVATQPSSPDQTCTVNQVTQYINGENVGNVSTTCEYNDTTAPAVLTTSPGSDETNIELDRNVEAIFSEDMLGTSIDESTFQVLSENGNVIYASIEFDGVSNKATLDPGKSLSLLSKYEAILSSDIIDISRNTLNEFKWNFTTRDGVWRGPQSIVSDGTEPKIAVNTNGVAIAIWLRSGNIWGRHYNPSIDIWENERQIGKDNSVNVVTS